MSATTGTDPAAVVDSYTPRIRFSRAEAVAVPRPRLLRGLLEAVTHVAEMPCGTGHFLADYAHAGAAVTLVDANPAALAAAAQHAAEAGVRTDRAYPVLAYLPQVQLPAAVDLVIAPNAALNQLARQTPLTELLRSLHDAMAPGAETLAQVACTHPGGGVDTATFYDATRPHQVWFADRWLQPAPTGAPVLRRRRQHRAGNHLRIEFDYRATDATSLHTTAVELELFHPAALAAAFTAAGFGCVRFLPGQSGLSEVLASTPAAQARR